MYLLSKLDYINIWRFSNDGDRMGRPFSSKTKSDEKFVTFCFNEKRAGPEVIGPRLQ
jgi:hypothetical protein